MAGALDERHLQIYTKHPWINPLGTNGQSYYTWYNGEIQTLQWERMNNSISDLWVRVFGKNNKGYAQLLQENVDLNVNGKFPWRINIPPKDLAANQHYVVIFTVPNLADRTAYPWGIGHQIPSQGFHILPNDTYTVTSVAPSILSNTIATGYPSVSLASASRAAAASASSLAAEGITPSASKTGDGYYNNGYPTNAMPSVSPSPSNSGGSHTHTPSPTPASDSSLSTGAKAGIGVGVSLGVLLLVAIAALIWTLRTRSRRSHAANTDMAYQHGSGGGGWHGYYTGADPTTPKEMPVAGDPKELAAPQRIAELPGDFGGEEVESKGSEGSELGTRGVTPVGSGNVSGGSDEALGTGQGAKGTSPVETI